jgi:ankyrin repeat protein
MNLEEFLAYLAEEPGWSGGPVGVHSRATCGDTPLHDALWARDDEAARALVEAGADVTAAGEERYTPLHIAVAHANVEMARELARRGASWDAVSDFGTTPADAARRSDDAAIRALAP